MQTLLSIKTWPVLVEFRRIKRSRVFGAAAEDPDVVILYVVNFRQQFWPKFVLNKKDF
jgi:hypothetical protein